MAIINTELCCLTSKKIWVWYYSGPMIRAYFFISLTLFLVIASKSWSSITRMEAQAVISIFEQELTSPIQSLFNAKFNLELSEEFDNPEHPVAASADRSGNNWSISILAASRSHPQMTIDSFVLLICHELGHHFGGAPFKKEQDGSLRWASTEGQADYYATALCAKRIFKLLPAPFFDSFKYPKDIKKKCQENTNGRQEASLCARSIVASVAFLKALSGHPLLLWDSTDPFLVPQTLGITPHPISGQYQYPSDQCRLETLVKGALCQQVTAPNTSELLGRLNSQGFCQEGPFARPSCWYLK